MSLYNFDNNLKIQKVKNKSRARGGDRPMVMRNGKGMWGERIYLQPSGAGLGGKQEPSQERILAEEGDIKGRALSTELLR